MKMIPWQLATSSTHQREMSLSLFLKELQVLLIRFRTDLVGWMRIRIPNADPYPEKRAEMTRKIETVEKFHVLKCWMFSFEG